ncbi:OB-fold domain-containing protein [Arthrobacter sp. MYb213]|uniref:Zn-ribbon domain-containing OB-fold protein n=1 Tax=Arthrobacter sp. MYb213 TaxID=1848595 RepID=UPI000CFD9756|nr:OB-fold domain-containing protein [Arthrobacter sp. MYb213]PRB70399.1 hypothetical protein CQ011_09630 [Arthrobacter sp. MYb213]
MTETISEKKQRTAVRPRPAINFDNKFYFDALNQGELAIQKCLECSQLRHPPTPMCPSCHCLDWRPGVMSGRGEVFSFVVMHHPIVPPFEAGYVVAVIELEEGPRVVMNIEGIKAEQVVVGMPVLVSAERMDEDLVLPVARPIGARS